jgi:outer membrane protein TolC
MSLARTLGAPVLVLVAWPLAGQTPPPSPAPDPVPFARLLEQARASSPRLAELGARLTAARARAESAGALEDPMLEARLQNMALDRWTVGDEEMAMVEVGARQALPAPGKRAARRELAAAEAEVAAAELAAAERELARDLARQIAELWAADREIALLDDAHDLLELAAATAVSRYGVGEGGQAAPLRAQLELSRHDAEREATVGARERAAAELRALLATAPGAPIGPWRDLPPIAALPADLVAQAEREAAAIAVRRAEIAAAERRLAIERLELRPDFEVAAGVGYRGDFDPALILGVGMELPLWRRQRQEPIVRAAEAELAAAREAERAAVLAARAEAERALADWARREGQLRLYDEAVLPQTSAVFDASRAGYLAARGELSTVLEGATLWLAARVERIRLAADRFAIHADAALLMAPTAPGEKP